MAEFTATYSPDDNKLRLYASARLDEDLYKRVRGAGFIWAPKQALFVAPMWTPDRADLAIELAGDIGDEDTSLTERAEERAERFEEYHENRTADAEQAQAGAARIMDGIPFGQPILVGHHSEKHARKDAERIEDGLRRAVKMWDTAEYWKRRAAGAIAHAKYKELPGVRARRIKGIEADRRKAAKHKDRAEKLIAMWSKPLDTPMKDGSISARRRVVALANLDTGYYARTFDHRLKDEQGRPTGNVYHNGPLSLWDAAGGNIRDYDPELAAYFTPEEVAAEAIRNHQGTIAWADRWIAHYDNRLSYERAMLQESGGLITDRSAYPIVVGGRVLVRGEWVTVIRVNRKDGQILSVTTNARYVSVRGIEEVKDYQPPTAEAAKAAKAVSQQPPIINEDVPGAVHVTKAEFDQRRKYGSACYRAFPAEGAHARYRQAVQYRGGEMRAVFLSDQKIKPRPLADETIERVPLAPPERVIPQRVYVAPPPSPADALRDTLKAGIQVVSAPQLFPTPEAVARQVVELADIQPGECVLEPSAGTGNLIAPIVASVDTEILAYEINAQLCAGLRAKFPSYRVQVRQADFLTVTDHQGCYPKIVMNPPFKDGADIAHIEHARTFLAPGGRLVAVCANGPRQGRWFEKVAEECPGARWIALPAGSFSEQGTDVNAAIVVIEREAMSA